MAEGPDGSASLEARARRLEDQHAIAQLRTQTGPDRAPRRFVRPPAEAAADPTTAARSTP